MKLSFNLEFATLNHPSIGVCQLEDIQTPGIIGQVNLRACRKALNLHEFFSKEIVHLESGTRFGRLLELEIDETGGGIWVKPYDFPGCGWSRLL